MIEPISRGLAADFRALFGGGTLTGLGEGELLDRFVNARDEAAFEELVARHGPMVLSVCRRWLDDPHDVDDAFQATFLVLVRKAAGLRDRRSVAAWLFGVSERVARHARASSRRRRDREIRAAAHLRTAAHPSAGPDPSDELAGREVRAMVDEEIRRLPPGQREAAVLGLVRGMTHRAAAEALGWPLGTFKTRVADARATLARRLARRGIGPAPLAALARVEGPVFPIASTPVELARRAVSAAVAGSSAVGLSGPAAELARRAARGMFAARLVPVALGFVAVCGLAAPAWWSGLTDDRPDGPIAPPPRPAHRVQAVPRVDLHGDPLPAGALLRLGTSRHRQDSPICRIAWTPDGKRFITDGEDSILRVWDADAGRIIRRIDPGVGAMVDYAPTSDGRRAMVVGTTIAPSRGLRHDVVLIDLETGRREDRGSWPIELPANHPIAIAPDRRILAIGIEGAVRIVDAWNGAEIVRLDLDGRHIDHIRFARDGRRLAVETAVGDFPNRKVDLRLYDLEPVREWPVIQRTAPLFLDFAFSPDGRRIAFAIGASLGLRDVASDGPGSSMELYSGDHLSFTPDGKAMVAVAQSGWIHRIDPATGKKTETIRAGITFERQVALSPDGRTLLGIGGEGVLRRWDFAAHRDRFDVPDSHIEPVTSILFTTDGKSSITGGTDATLRIWDLDTGKPIRTLRLSGPVAVAAVSPGGRWLAAATTILHQIFVWDLQGRDGPFVVSHGNGLTSLVSPKALLFTGEDSLLLVDAAGALHRIDVKARTVTPGAELRIAEPKPDLPSTGEHRLARAAFFPDGKRLAANGIFTNLQILDVATGREIRHLEGGDPIVCSPDGKTLAIATSGGRRLARVGRCRNRGTNVVLQPTSGTIRLVDAGTGRDSATIAIEGSRVWALAFSPDGKTLAATSGWESGEIRLYEVETGRAIRTITAPPLRSPGLAFTPDGSRLVTGMADGSVLVWDVRAGH